jgi:hypothetical protein
VSSLLISLRRGEGETEERASVEYDIVPLVWSNGDFNFKLNRVQTLGKFNHRLDSSWDDVLVKLDDRISVMEYEKLFDTLQIEGEFGGKKVFSDYEIKEYDRSEFDTGVTSINKGVYLAWENDSIMQLNSYNYNVAPVRQNWGDDDDEFPL